MYIALDRVTGIHVYSWFSIFVSNIVLALSMFLVSLNSTVTKPLNGE
jgi:hypothetical protein